MLAGVVEVEAYAAEWRTLRPVENRSAPVASLPWTQEPGPRPAEVAGRPRERHIDPNGYLPAVYLAEARHDRYPLLSGQEPAAALKRPPRMSAPVFLTLALVVLAFVSSLVFMLLDTLPQEYYPSYD